MPNRGEVMSKPAKNEFLNIIAEIKTGTVTWRRGISRIDLALEYDNKEIVFGDIPRFRPYSTHDNIERIPNVVSQYQRWLDGDRKPSKPAEKSVALSPAQKHCIEKLKESNGELFRHRGGFWSARDVEFEHLSGVGHVPVWSVSGATVKALLKRNVVVVSELKGEGENAYPIAVKLRSE